MQSRPQHNHFASMSSSSSTIFILLLISLHSISSIKPLSNNTLPVNKPLRSSSNSTLVSSGRIFELGFFTPGSSSNEYIGIWYVSNKTIVIWVANRESPVVRTPGKLTLLNNGVLQITDADNSTIWSSSSVESVQNPIAQLLDSGNFVVMDKNHNIASDNYAWEGFEHACDTRVPRMKIGYNVQKKHNVYLSSWKNLNDPAEGEYTFKLDITGIPQYFYKNGDKEIFRLGPWNGETFSGSPRMKPDSTYKFSYTSDDKWIYFVLEPISNSMLSRTVLGVNGTLLHFIGLDNSIVLNMTLAFVTDTCGAYNWCGTYASCDTNKSPVCECLTGYEPKSQSDWNKSDWTNGCVEKTHLNFTTGDKFHNISGVKVPDTRNAYQNSSLSLEECKIACLENSSCTAYGNLLATDQGKGCLLWFGELKDIKVYADSGQDIFVRLTSVPLSESYVKLVIIICSVVSALVLIVIVTITIICHRRRKAYTPQQNAAGTKDETSMNNDNPDLPVFDIKTISKATDNFSNENKLGEGGFGPVYKGVLEGGQEIAVKKLSHDSKQGSDEFKNEVMCISKLQHRNLVKLIGCCSQDDEHMLVYEYMPNRSLDLLLFDDKSSTVLDWPKRWRIMKGLARGLVYLHQDSQLIIIHRDLKASNVLLDSDMNPKISDFGMARICGSSGTAANTARVVGTYGYMSPEYAMEGLFSEKSDVFSFGVLVLEIVSGKRCRGFYQPEHHLSLLGHTWELFNQERFMEVLDERLTETHDAAEVVKAINIGLLCVQQNPNDRPTMANVILMLTGDFSLSSPKVPGFMASIETEFSSSNQLQQYVMNPK